MKTSGIVRRVDELGRVVLPVELRRNLDIEERDPLEITLEGDRIVLRKYQQTCIFCSTEDELIDYHGKRVCRNCIENLKALDE